MERRRRDGHPPLSPYQRALGSCKGFQARLDKVEACAHNQLQVDLADMKASPSCWWPSGRGAAEGPSCEHHRGGHEEGVPSPGVPANVYPTTAPSLRGSSRS